MLGEQTCPFESVAAELILTSMLCDMQQVKLSTVATVTAQRANDTPYHLDELASVCQTQHTVRGRERQG